MISSDKLNKKIALAVLLSVALLLCAPFVGSKLLLPSDLLADTLDGTILRRMRIPRVLLGFFAGAALSFGGACFQSLFRNGLASPYTLGLSGGAALGVSIAAWLGVGGTLLGMGANGIAAFAGAFIVSALVYMLSRCGRRNDGNTLLLAGVAISFFTSSVIMFVQYAGREGELFRVMRAVPRDEVDVRLPGCKRLYAAVYTGAIVRNRAVYLHARGCGGAGFAQRRR